MIGKIPVVVVDDSEIDRYIVKRRLSKWADFGDVFDATDGDLFLESFYDGHGEWVPPLLILMDVNMPRMGGFETIEEIQRRIADGKGPKSVVIMMFSSSNNPADLARAKALNLVKGYIHKPLDAEGVQQILATYASRDQHTHH